MLSNTDWSRSRTLVVESRRRLEPTDAVPNDFAFNTPFTISKPSPTVAAPNSFAFKIPETISNPSPTVVPPNGLAFKFPLLSISKPFPKFPQQFHHY